MTEALRVEARDVGHAGVDLKFFHRPFGASTKLAIGRTPAEKPQCAQIVLQLTHVLGNGDGGASPILRRLRSPSWRWRISYRTPAWSLIGGGAAIAVVALEVVVSIEHRVVVLDVVGAADLAHSLGARLVLSRDADSAVETLQRGAALGSKIAVDRTVIETQILEPGLQTVVFVGLALRAYVEVPGPRSKGRSLRRTET